MSPKSVSDHDECCFVIDRNIHDIHANMYMNALAHTNVLIKPHLQVLLSPVLLLLLCVRQRVCVCVFRGGLHPLLVVRVRRTKLVHSVFAYFHPLARHTVWGINSYRKNLSSLQMLKMII